MQGGGGEEITLHSLQLGKVTSASFELVGGMVPADRPGHRRATPSASTVGKQQQDGTWAPAQQPPANTEGQCRNRLWKRLFWCRNELG